MLDNKLELANLPTPIYKLENLSKKYNKNIYIKRDDFTGIEMSGNKVRKLEYALKEAIDQDCDVVITMGGIQSNHCRATAAACAKLGLKCHLLITKNEDIKYEGNLLMNSLFGAEISFIDIEDKATALETYKEKYSAEGMKAYTIPIGASFSTGNLGYINAFNEIVEYDTKFDTVVCTVGSGGTYAGLFIGNKLNGDKHDIYGFSISDESNIFIEEISRIADNSIEKYGIDIEYKKEDIIVNDKYKGLGYAKSQDEEIDFIKEVAKLEGILFDPVYTGKAFYGMMNEIINGELKDIENFLFVHTGGLYGLLAKHNLFYKGGI